MSNVLRISFYLLFLLFEIMNSLKLEELFWGTYKPHLLFALTQKSLNPITFGFLYYNLKNKDSKHIFLSNVRFKYNNHVLARYLEHNGYDYAFEQIEDQANFLLCDISYMKENYSSFQQQTWKTTFDAMFKYSEDFEEADEQIKNNKLVFSFYVTVKNHIPHQTKNFMGLKVKEYKQDHFLILEVFERSEDNVETAKGFVKLEAMEENCFESKSFHEIFQVNDADIWNIDNIYYDQIIQSEKFKRFERSGEEITNEGEEKSNDNYYNIAFINFFFEKNCKFVISYDSLEVPKEINETSHVELEKQKKEHFYHDFIEKFMVSKDISYEDPIFLGRLKLSMYAFSNLIGGITHYYGRFHEVNNIFQHYFKEVFSCTPSRAKFPRGFLWDEGFHLLIICKYDLELCMIILGNWFDLMDFNGWIAREQIRNEETAYGLEERFIKQDNYEGNPPTLLFPLLYLIKNFKRGNLNNEKFIDFVEKCYNKIKLWFFWFLENQTDDEKMDFFKDQNIFYEKLHFRWHCKGDCHNGDFLGSGLDDFPRQLPGTLSVSHLDLHVWLVFMAESLGKIAGFLNQQVEMKEYQNIFQRLSQKMQTIFFDSKEKIFKDVMSLIENDELVFNENFGYINLFPLFFGYNQDLESLKQYFKKIMDYEELWTDFGIRSLSKKSRYFGTGDNYWRGPIWIPINYLILRGLKVFYNNNEEANKIYTRLRDNLIRNLMKNFELTGLVWENYNAWTGIGQREAGFCGWSALITLILKEEYF